MLFKSFPRLARGVVGLMLAGAGLGALPLSAQAASELIFIRHGEKPEKGLGQLNCQGLNRALALPKVLLTRYGTPDLLVAPNPGATKQDWGVVYNYVRPLATIEPLAIRLGMPVDTTLAWDDQDGLVTLLQARVKGGAQRVVIAWEHHLAGKVARALLESWGYTEPVPPWPSDYDSIYRVLVDDAGKATLKIEAQGLNDLPTTCP